MEAYSWLIILAAWWMLLALGLAGGDPLAVGRAGREAPAIRLAKWTYRSWKARHGASETPRHAAQPAPRIGTPARQSESGFHAVA